MNTAKVVLDKIEIKASTETGHMNCYRQPFGAQGLGVAGEASCIDFFDDRSNAERFRINHGVDSFYQPYILRELFAVYLTESRKYFKPHSGFGGWWANETLKTPSPQVDTTRVNSILQRMSEIVESDSGPKRVIINNQYLKEKQKYLHYFKDTAEEYIDKLFRSVSEVIVQLPYSAIAVEFTTDKGVFFEMRMRNFVLHFKLIVSSEPTGFFALYQDTNPIENGVGPINDVLERLLEIKKNAITTVSRDTST